MLPSWQRIESDLEFLKRGSSNSGWEWKDNCAKARKNHHYGYTGLVQYEGAWFYVTEGTLDADKFGFVEYGGANFYVVNGRIV